MFRKSYPELKVSEVINKLSEEGYWKGYICYLNEAGEINNLVFEDKQFYVTDGKKMKIGKPYPQTLYALLRQLGILTRLGMRTDVPAPVFQIRMYKFHKKPLTPMQEHIFHAVKGVEA